MTIDELRREALQLNSSVRADSAREFLESLDELPEPEVERLWLEGAERRRADVQAGKVIPIRIDEVFARARAARA